MSVCVMVIAIILVVKMVLIIQATNVCVHLPPPLKIAFVLQVHKYGLHFEMSIFITYTCHLIEN